MENTLKYRPFSRELRLAVVKNCNFRCFFCHSEGLDRHGKEPKTTVEAHTDLLDVAMTVGFDDITFTGGEPSLRSRELAEIIRKLADRATPPAITIVSNASQISDDLLDALATYPGVRKANISLHAIDEAGFDAVTVTRGYWSRVEGNLKRLIQAGIPVKLNTVMLKGVNTGHERLFDHLRYAHELGASAIKLIEFLVTPDNREHFNYFYSLDAVLRDLEQINVQVVRESARTILLASPEFPGLSIEAVRCVCKMGCSHCHELRDVQLDADHLYHPCFIQSSEGISVGTDAKEMTQALVAGREQIDQYAKIYGDDSPLLIHRDKFVSSRQEVFWQAPQNFTDHIQGNEKAYGLELRKIRRFRLNYCIPVHWNEDWTSCRLDLKFGYDEHTPNRFEVIFSDYEYEPSPHGLLVTVNYRMSESQVIPAANESDAWGYMEAHGYRRWFSHDFAIHDYWHQSLGFTISLDMNDNPPSVRLDPASIERSEVRDCLKTFGFSPLHIPLATELARKAVANPPASSGSEMAASSRDAQA
jgi:molybdenum cofactor biosynthesis enzyme MoaA